MPRSPRPTARGPRWKRPASCSVHWQRPELTGNFPVRPRGPDSVAALHMGLALAACVALGVTQLFAFSQMGALADRSSGMRSFALAIFATSFLVFTVVSLVRSAVFMAFAWIGATRAARKTFPAVTRWPRVTVLVPAFNEATRIERALQALLALDYPGLEAIIVDDGSTDDTFARAQRFSGRHGDKRIRVVRKENGGKWSALNLAFHLAESGLVACVDADSQLDAQS